MNESLFLKWVASFFPLLTTLIEKINGKRNGTLTYLHKDTTILKKVFSPDNKWESTSVNTTYVSADFVAMDSELPIKSRDSIASANGKLPKSAISKKLKESDITQLNIMEKQGGNAARIRKKLADDPVACNVGLDELMEYSFLFGLCEGYVAMPDADKEGSLMRLNYGYLAANTFGATTKGVISLSDIKHVISTADSRDQNTVIKVWISKTTYDALRQTREARELVAGYNGQSYTEDTTLPVPTAKRFNEAFTDDTGATFQVINRTVLFEKNGKKTSKKPWNNNRIIFECNEQVGSFVYGQLAEATNHVDGVTYSLIDDYKLISEYSLTNPLREVTGGQALAAPVIEDVDQVYVLDLTLSEEVDETAEKADTSDTYITVWGKKYTKADVIKQLAAITGNRVASNIGDDTLISKINELSEEDEETLKNALTPAS